MIGSLGTFLFSSTAQHSVHIVFQSLKPEQRNLDDWKKVSTMSTAAGALVQSQHVSSFM
jgi:hypothetical protein